MKKVLKTILTIVVIGVSFSLFAGFGNSLNNTIQFKGQSGCEYNKYINLTIPVLDNSGKKYVNKTVQVSGNVTELKYEKSGSYLVVLRKGKNTIKCITDKAPEIKLNSKVSVIGDYNGGKIAVAVLTYKNNLYNFKFNN